jgi:hypothetical protein
MSRTEAEMKLAAFVPMLMRDFPDAAFTADSLSHVARRAMKGFPIYGELAAWLGEWWAERRPMPVALPAPDPRPLLHREPPTPEIVEAVHRAANEAIAALRSSAVTRDTVGRPIGERAGPPEQKPRYLSPAQLDQINPLPNGRKRVAEGVP